MQWKRLKICEWEELCNKVSSMEGKLDILIVMNAVFIAALIAEMLHI
jgi:hypothetical protein